MKVIAKYLLVEEEIKDGDVITNADSFGLMFMTAKGAEQMTDEDRKNVVKVKLFAMSTDVKKGDDAYDLVNGFHFGTIDSLTTESDGQIKAVHGNGETGNVQYWIPGTSPLGKSIGEVSPEVDWVKDGDVIEIGEGYWFSYGSGEVEEVDYCDYGENPIGIAVPIHHDEYGKLEGIFVKCPCCGDYK